MHKKLSLVVGVILGMPLIALGAPVFSYQQAQSVIPVSSTDLVDMSQPSYGGSTSAGFTSYDDGSGASSPAILNDGSGGTYGVHSVQTAVTTQNTPWTLTYTLAGSATGYDITGVNISSLWNTDYVDQDYQVAFAPATNLTNFTPYATEIANNTTGQPGEDIQSSLTDDTGFLAKNVGAIQFTFSPDSTDAYGHQAAYTEVDVLGMASPTPEPASIGMLLAGGMVVLVRRRGRRG
ncbi:MAG TPA: PEP-CTERM sorting domain-containing protein [Tepidisphaeraceae bacterium]|nr:PEP-CTERM sorting domain-containing protein [Tepidisphaeraceae bacterium]